jgi:hypothetical protein
LIENAAAEFGETRTEDSIKAVRDTTGILTEITLVSGGYRKSVKYHIFLWLRKGQEKSQLRRRFHLAPVGPVMRANVF